MCFDGGQAHAQMGGDIGVGVPLGNGGGDLVLARGERGEPAPRLLLPGGRVGVPGYEADEAAGDRRRQRAVAGVHGLDRGHDVAGGRSL